MMNWIGGSLDNIVGFFEEVYDSAADGVDAAGDGIMEIEKTLEKAMIQLVYAPTKKGDVKSAKTQFDHQVRYIANQAKNNIDNIVVKMDDSMKGKFSNSIKESIQTTNSGWQDITKDS